MQDLSGIESGSKMLSNDLELEAGMALNCGNLWRLRYVIQDAIDKHFDTERANSYAAMSRKPCVLDVSLFLY